MMLKIVIFAGLIGLFMIPASGSPIPENGMVGNDFIKKVERLFETNHPEGKINLNKKNSVTEMNIMFSMKPNNYLNF